MRKIRVRAVFLIVLLVLILLVFFLFFPGLSNNVPADAFQI
ncbi:MAG: hypothetical protein WBI32_09900 [Halanaerobiales bacterium]|nr:hypothetical protein [Bacillota bacterium]HOA40319.1 hypothetical protein [Halanaerobiales bacterium]HPZ62313.1 hypothetical protein [Halanaerobiales bacterium]HQD03211.1 hypothetical protein [Halanaerobiales bacterium]